MKRLANARYRHTLRGCLMRAYEYAERRVTQGTAKYGPSTVGLALMPRVDFYNAALQDSEFLRLYEAWRASDYVKCYRPTPDRVDPNLGYVQGNIRWVTYKANTYRALGIQVHAIV